MYPIGIIFAPLIAFMGVYNAFWRLEVNGNEITLKTLFRRKSFTFHEIRRADGRVRASRSGSNIALYSDANVRLFSIRKTLIGTNLFVKRLRQMDHISVEITELKPPGSL
jgi:hypothetical protein